MEKWLSTKFLDQYVSYIDGKWYSKLLLILIILQYPSMALWITNLEYGIQISGPQKVQDIFKLSLLKFRFKLSSGLLPPFYNWCLNIIVIINTVCV